MQGESFHRHIARFIQRASGSDHTGKVRKRNALIAVGVLMDQGDVLSHLNCLVSHPRFSRGPSTCTSGCGEGRDFCDFLREFFLGHVQIKLGLQVEPKLGTVADEFAEP